jgi:hypothetical protein
MRIIVRNLYSIERSKQINVCSLLMLRNKFSTISSINKQLFESKTASNNLKEDIKPLWVPFSQPKYGNFYQEIPKIENQFSCDPFLQKYLQRVLPKEVIIFKLFYLLFH